MKKMSHHTLAGKGRPMLSPSSDRLDPDEEHELEPLPSGPSSISLDSGGFLDAERHLAPQTASSVTDIPSSAFSPNDIPRVYFLHS